jgi:hypothetical protein
MRKILNRCKKYKAQTSPNVSLNVSGLNAIIKEIKEFSGWKTRQNCK